MLLNIWNQDRKAAVNSFMCYWQIDYMIRDRSYGNFPLLEGIKIDLDKKDNRELE